MRWPKDSEDLERKEDFLRYPTFGSGCDSHPWAHIFLGSWPPPFSLTRWCAVCKSAADVLFTWSQIRECSAWRCCVLALTNLSSNTSLARPLQLRIYPVIGRRLQWTSNNCSPACFCAPGQSWATPPRSSLQMHLRRQQTHHITGAAISNLRIPTSRSWFSPQTIHNIHDVNWRSL